MAAQTQVLTETRAYRFKKQTRKLFRNRLTLMGFFLVLLVVTGGLLAPWIAPYPESITGEINFVDMHLAPNSEHFIIVD